MNLRINFDPIHKMTLCDNARYCSVCKAHIRCDRLHKLEQEAFKDGTDDGANAAGWWIQECLTKASTADAKACANKVIAGMENDVDPAVADTLPFLDLSGQWADGPSTDSILLGIGCDEEDNLSQEECDSLIETYREAYDGKVLSEIIHACHKEEFNDAV